MSFKQFLSESEDQFLKFFNFEAKMLPELVSWIDSLKLKTGKAPRGLKKEFEKLQWIARKVDFYAKFIEKPKHIFQMLNPDSDYDSYVESLIRDIQTSFTLMSVEDIKKVEAKLLNKAQEVSELKLSNATYYNESTMSSKKFVTQSKVIDKHLGTFTGVHKKALTVKPLVVRFVKKEQSKATAVYKTMLDEIYIRPDRKFITGDGYGSFVYIITHELGHRYEAIVKDNSKLHHIFTTNYSQKDTMSGSEAFGELFAISHFGEKKYPEFKDQIKKFKDKVV
jgi:hypothetical protein